MRPNPVRCVSPGLQFLLCLGGGVIAGIMGSKVLPRVNKVVALLLRSSGIARTPQGTGPGFKGYGLKDTEIV